MAESSCFVNRCSPAKRDRGSRGCRSGGLSRKRLLNPAGKFVKYSLRLPRWNRPMFRFMEMIPKTNNDGAQLALMATLLAACSVNLMLLCSWF